MNRSRSRARRVAALGITAAAVAAVASGQSATAATARHAIGAAKPAWVRQATSEGAVAKSTDVQFGLLLKMRNRAQAVRTLQRVSDPKSASYGKWLSHKSFISSYAPAAADVSAVRSWLKSQGLHVGSSIASGMYLEVSGSASKVETAFGTSLRNYRYQNRTVHANTTTLSVAHSTPARVLNAVSGVVGLDQGSQLKKPATALPGPPAGSRYGVPPCSKYYGQLVATDKPAGYGKKRPYAVCGYIPSQYQGAYGETPLIKKGITGKGVTVAITDAYASPTMLSDAQTYNKLHGVPLFTSGQYSEIRPRGYDVYNVEDAQGWYGEETLDVEAVHGMAPGAKVVFVSGSDDGNGLNEAWAKTIDNHVADIITNSWSYGSDLVDLPTAEFFDSFSLEAALTGITDNFSTGDDGDETSGGTNPSAKDVGFPADDPFVTGVGGSSVLIGASNQWLGEYGWSNAYAPLVNGVYTPTPPGAYSSGGGGGTSTLFYQPFYQVGKVPTSLSEANGSVPMRVIPDISMAGDPNTGFRVGETQKFPDGTYYDEYRIGGTSLSSPLLAGVIAVADQAAGHALGFVNPLYYKLLGTTALHDLAKPTSPVAQVRTNYTNFVDPSGGRTFILATIDALSGTLKDTKGYDNETGVGSPNGPAFFAALAKGLAG